MYGVHKLKLSKHEAQALRIALRAALLERGFQMIDETPRSVLHAIGAHGWYAETSHIDNLVRLYTRLNRILTGHKQFNAVIPYTRRPKS